MQTRLLAAPAALVAGTLAAAACGSGGTANQAGGEALPTATPTPTPRGLPFHYQSKGESSSPSFSVDKGGSYRVAYVLQGSADTPGCVVGVTLVADDGSSVPILSDVRLQPGDTRQDTVTETLGAGRWRFQEAGGCSWSVTVDAG
jgi:hypothetical protein